MLIIFTAKKQLRRIFLTTLLLNSITFIAPKKDSTDRYNHLLPKKEELLQRGKGTIKITKKYKKGILIGMLSLVGSCILGYFFYQALRYLYQYYHQDIPRLSMQALHDRITPYVTGDNPIEALKELLSNEEREKISNCTNIILQDVKAVQNISQFIAAINSINTVIKKNKITGKKAIDLYAHLIKQYTESNPDELDSNHSNLVVKEHHLLRGLVNLKDSTSKDFLASLLLKRSEATSYVSTINLGNIMESLGQVDPEILTRIVTALMYHKNTDIRIRVIKAFSDLKINQLVKRKPLKVLLKKSLYDAIEDKNIQIQVAAMRSIGHLGVEGKEPEITKKILEKVQKNDTNTEVKVVGIQALGSLKQQDEQVIKAILEIAKDHDAHIAIRNASVLALGTLADLEDLEQVDTIPYLIALLEEVGNPSSMRERASLAISNLKKGSKIRKHLKKIIDIRDDEQNSNIKTNLTTAIQKLKGE